MSKRFTTQGWLILATIAILVELSCRPAAATLSMMHTYRTGIDVGNDPGSGWEQPRHPLHLWSMGGHNTARPPRPSELFGPKPLPEDAAATKRQR